MKQNSYILIDSQTGRGLTLDGGCSEEVATLPCPAVPWAGGILASFRVWPMNWLLSTGDRPWALGILVEVRVHPPRWEGGCVPTFSRSTAGSRCLKPEGAM